MSVDLRRGALHVTAAGAAFALMSAFAKAASQLGVSGYLLVFARNVVSVSVLMPLLLRQGPDAFRTRRPGGHLWRACFGLLGMYTLYYALAHLPLAEALLLNYSSPLFIPFIAWLVLRERPPALLIPASLLGLAGVALIVKPASLGLSFASLVGAASGVFAACAASATPSPRSAWCSISAPSVWSFRPFRSGGIGSRSAGVSWPTCSAPACSQPWASCS